jgi:chromosome segregation ATPase
MLLCSRKWHCCTRTIEAAKSSVQLHEQSVLLSQIIEEESNQAEISNLEARVQQLTRELALKDAIISKQSCSVPSYDQAALNAEAALKAEVASLQKECASLAKQNHEAASAYKALQTEVASLQRASSTAQNASAAVVELMSLLADFEKKVPKLSSTIARLELDLQSEKQQRVRAEQSLETALSRESSSNEALHHTAHDQCHSMSLHCSAPTDVTIEAQLSRCTIGSKMAPGLQDTT